MTLHLSHMGFTEGLTFITVFSLFVERAQDLLRHVILPFVKS